MVAIVHIGLPKTGSTYLQRIFFPHLGFNFETSDNYSYRRKIFDFIGKSNYHWHYDLYHKSSIYCKEKRCDQFSKFERSYANTSSHTVQNITLNSDNNHTYLLSSEGICGFSPQVCRYNNSILRKMGVSKCIFFVRNQVDYAKSIWKQLFLKEDRFRRYISPEKLFYPVHKSNPFPMNWCEYINVIDEIYGRDNVLVLPYELMLLDYMLFINILCSFMNVTKVPTP